LIVVAFQIAFFSSVNLLLLKFRLEGVLSANFGTLYMTASAAFLWLVDSRKLFSLSSHKVYEVFDVFARPNPAVNRGWYFGSRLYILSVCAGYVVFFATTTYGTIPKDVGGGRVKEVILIPKAEARSILVASGITVHADASPDSISGVSQLFTDPIGLLVEIDGQYVLLAGQADSSYAVTVRADLISAVMYTTQRTKAMRRALAVERLRKARVELEGRTNNLEMLKQSLPPDSLVKLRKDRIDPIEEEIIGLERDLAQQ
jgi:hypothetical protein